MADFQLRITSKNHFGKVFPVSNQSPQVFGRGKSCDHHIDDYFVSQQQFRIKPETLESNHQCTQIHLIQDLESQHGTRVNGNPIHSITLCQGDTIQVGTTKFIYEFARAQSRFVRFIRSFYSPCATLCWKHVHVRMDPRNSNLLPQKAPRRLSAFERSSILTNNDFSYSFGVQ